MKYSAIALDIADRQNAYSITLAIRATIKLFRLVSCKIELYYKILAFLILYNYKLVRIYRHYLVINKKDTKYYYYLIYTFDFIALNKREKWIIYKFTKNIYNI